VLAAVALCTYPFLVWLGLTSRSPRPIALLLLCILAPAVFFRLRSRSKSDLRGVAAIPLVTVASLGAATVLDDMGLMLAVPVAINAIFLVTFGSTLRSGSVPMIERFARLQVADLTTDQVSWCRQWTRIWCLFFVLNGGTALALSIFAPLSWWAFYNGLLAYLLIGILLGTEWVLRHRRFPNLANGAGEGGSQ